MRIWPFLLVALIFLSGCTGHAVQTNTNNLSSSNCEKEIAKIPQIIKDNTGNDFRLFKVSKTTDGDTIELTGGQKVRFLEINTPEKGMKWAAEATQLTDSLTKNGVYLQKDTENEDKYGRWLRYVFTEDSFVNAELIEEGLATVFIVGNDTKYAVLMKCLENEAKQNKRGIWSAANKYDISLFVNYYDEYVVITNNGNDAISLQNWVIKDEATHIYTFPDVLLSPKANVTLYTGNGVSTKTELYWNSKEPIWNNDGDTAFLFDANGDLASTISFP